MENDALRLATFIDLEQYHKTIQVIKTASLAYRTRCILLKMNCEKEFNELTASHDDLVTRLNNVYLILLERPHQRKKRFVGIVAGVIGIAFGIGNSIQASNLAKDVENMRNYMRDNFNDISETLKIQGQVQVELKKQQNHISGVLAIHQKRIEEIEKRLESLEKFTSELQKRVEEIRMTVIFQGLKLDVLTILGKLRELEQWMLDLKKNVLHAEIFSPQNITDAMMKHTLTAGKFLAPPTLSNFEHITETIVGSAFVVREMKAIFVNLKIPIYQDQKLNLYDIIDVPVIKDKKVLRIANNRDNYCVISEDTNSFDCGSGSHKFTKGKHFYFSTDNTDISLLPTASSRSCIIDIFTQKSLDRCRYKGISQNIEIVKEIDDHKFLFAIRDKTKYNLECDTRHEDGSVSHYNNLDKDEYLKGTGIMYLGPNCKLDTEHFETNLKTSKRVVNSWKDVDVFNFEDLQEDVEEKLKSSRFPKRLDNEKFIINFEDVYQL